MTKVSGEAFESKKAFSEYLYRDYGIPHAPIKEEIGFYDAIRSGNVYEVLRRCNEPFTDKKGLGKLSEDSLRNMKYHLIIFIAAVARECIRGGMSTSESFTMSDFFIQLVDKSTSFDEMNDIHDDMCIRYTTRMDELNKKNVKSLPIMKCINYIFDNLDTRITVERLAQEAGVSEAYLSRLFKKETGYTISGYIMWKKLSTAKSMLINSNYSIAEISASLAFPNQSYLTNLMVKDCGLTPKKFRDKYLV